MRTECSLLCMKKPASSLFHMTSTKQLLEFKWHNLCAELKRRTPTLYAILEAASQRSRSRTSSLFGVVMTTGVLLKCRNQQMGLLQTIVSTLDMLPKKYNYQGRHRSLKSDTEC